jgi:aconitase A
MRASLTPRMPMNATRHRKPLPGTLLDYFDARAAVDAIAPGAYAKLPYTARVHAENLVRRADPDKLDAYLGQLIARKRDLDFPWFPARVVCHDILGQTALVDLAGLRDAIADMGGDPAQVNPVVPVQLIVDHSLAVEHAGFERDAFAKNRAIEDRRNDDRFHFIDWTRKAFRNVEVIPPGNGIMHQINLERMSPVIQVQDGVAYPDTCVGTDSHTPHVDALGVIAIGVGGLEAENVMLGRASWMRLPDITGVELSGRPAPGITATDVVLALTEFLRKEKVVGAYLEFHGEGAAALTLGDRATISNMAPEYGATAAMFFIDQQTIDYLKLTGRDDAQVRLVETYAKHTGLWADTLTTAEYERVLKFDLSSVVRNMAGPSNPHKRLPTSALAEREIAKTWAMPDDGSMPDGAVIIAAITSCTNTSNPRNVIAAGLLARNANARGLTRKPWVKTSLAPGSKAVQLYLEEAKLLPELEQLGFGIVAFACTTCNGMSRRARSEDPAGDHRSRSVCDRGVVRQSQFRRAHPSVREAGLPGVAAAGCRLRDRRHHSLRHREGRARHRPRWQGSAPQGPVAERRRDRRDREDVGEAGTLPQSLRPDVRPARRCHRQHQAAV